MTEAINCVLCHWTARIILFCLLCPRVATAPVNEAPSTSQGGPAFRNDIAAALTAREACSDSDHSTPLTGEVAACHGEWYGHVTNASSLLCMEGFSVCSWEDTHVLKRIPWSLARQIPGCYAYNAAQYSGQCKECREDDVESSHLAGLGHDCPNSDPNQAACLSRGVISATTGNSCGFVDEVTTGILCCRRRPTSPPRPQNDGRTLDDKTMMPPTRIVRLVGERVQLHCPLTGVDHTSRSHSNTRKALQSRQGNVLWFKGNQVLRSRNTATWTIKFASTSDSGVYSCRAGDSSAAAVGHINLTINSVHTGACVDGTSDGFHDSHHVRACAGAWTGHVRRAAATLCGKGWRVCTPKDRPFLDQIDPIYLNEFGGCFGYNAAHMDTMRGRKRCRKCKDRQVMAALGGDCPVNEKVGEDGTNSPSTCYSNRKILAYVDKPGQPQATSGCNYRPGRGITGVMCCRRWRRAQDKQAATNSSPLQTGSRQPESSQSSAETVARECYPACRNGGTCLASGQCLCPKGYTGQACQHGGCSPRCLNGGECLYGYCKCAYPFHGDHCQFSSHMPMDAPSLSESNRRTLESNKLEDSLKRRRALNNPTAQRNEGK